MTLSTPNAKSVEARTSAGIQKPGRCAAALQGVSWLISIGVLVLVWEWAASNLSDLILPSVTETFSALNWLLHRASFYEHLRLTLLRGGAGFLFAMLVGGLLGLLMGRYDTLGQLLNPLVIIASTVPPIFWVAIIIVWMGLGSGPPIIVIAITATPLVMATMVQGVRSIPPTLIEMATIFRVGAWTQLRELYLPALSGHLFTSALIALRFSWRTVMMAEFVGSSSGLGNRLAWARQNLEMDLAFAYMLVMVGFGMLMEYGLLRPAQKRWGWEAGGQSRVRDRSV